GRVVGPLSVDVSPGGCWVSGGGAACCWPVAGGCAGGVVAGCCACNNIRGKALASIAHAKPKAQRRSFAAGNEEFLIMTVLFYQSRLHAVLFFCPLLGPAHWTPCPWNWRQPWSPAGSGSRPTPPAAGT